ncbi:hypothetical protein N7541_008548 [Penicillium brevicompactum]|uniref:Epidermal growth factor receptor-like transmembrane-juxtamembrane segment domain-containing protein n=1 Tax=Penicillium brevicompactum TaxID=5074 RepID=A0A9W9QZB0_PENBR|nr:hypothetical protein N7541_008548 [Penicillium brevicompactum]
MSDDYVSGYAIRRNNTCESSETLCTKGGATWGDYQACCPGNSFCFDSDTGIPNIICCANQNNCTAVIAEKPSCADQSWNLFNWNGSFCCDQGQSGFHVLDRVLVGCSEALKPGNDSFIDLKTLSTGKFVAHDWEQDLLTFDSGTSTATSTSMSSTSTSSPSITSTSAAESDSSSGSSTNTGAIAGGVVGGVVGVAAIIALLFFFMRRRKQQNYQPQAQTEYDQHSQPPSSTVYSEVGDGLPRKELDGQTRSEIGGTHIQTPQELPASH